MVQAPPALLPCKVPIEKPVTTGTSYYLDRHHKDKHKGLQSNKTWQFFLKTELSALVREWDKQKGTAALLNKP